MCVDVTILGDDLAEDNENFVISLFSLEANVQTPSATVLITDDDQGIYDHVILNS